MIPALGDGGQLPVGRYVATVNEIQETFVDDDRLAASTTRPRLWDGFEFYLAAWAGAEESLSVPGLLHRMWVGGSFVSSDLDPADIDVTVIVDDELYQACKGKRGAGVLRELFGNRQRVRERFGVEPFRIPWKPITSVLDLGRLTPEEQEYLILRGAYDDLWERVRPPGPKGPLLANGARATRGYLEVIL